MIKSLKEVKVGERLGFFQAILTGTSTISWKDIMKESHREIINEKLIKELLKGTHDPENDSLFKGNK